MMDEGAVILGNVVMTHVKPTGWFFSSDKSLNAVTRMAIASQASNLHGIPTDCPQRDERLGWLADAHLSAEMPFFDTTPLFLNWAEEIVVSQEEAGSGALIDFVPDRDPEDGNPIKKCNRTYARPADPSWGAAFPGILDILLRTTGDIKILAKFYEPLRKFLRQTQSMADPATGLLTWGKLADWYGTFISDQGPISGFQQIFGLHVGSRFARALGLPDEWSPILERVKKVYNENFLLSNDTYRTKVGRCALRP
jgi:alpha-L-rhamnosidase